MARIRTIKPEFWLDEDLAEISEASLLLAIGLLNHADDEGYFRANPALIKAAVFPIREPSLSIHGALTELSNIGYLELFSGTDGRQYGHIKNFSKHQKVNRPSDSRIKELFDSLNIHGGLTEDSPPERKGKDIKKNPPSEGKKKVSGKGKTLVPEDWHPDEKLTDWFHDQQFGFTLADMREQYVDGCRSKGLKYIDHNAAFRNWSKSRHDRQQANGGGGSRQSRAAETQDKLRAIAERSLAEERASQAEGGGST